MAKNKRNPTDQFRSLSQMLLTDQRNLDAPRLFYGQPFSIEEYRERINKFSLPRKCPTDIRTQFDIARNLYLYAWHVYRFTSPAQAQAYATLEFALRTRLKELGIKFNEKRSGLRGLMNLALGAGLIRNGDFPHARHSPQGNKIDLDGTDFCKIVIDAASTFRNSYAHGGTTLLTLDQSLMALDTASAVIRQLYGGRKKLPKQ